KRSVMDAFAVESHQRASAAWSAGAFNDEIVPVTVGKGDKAKTVSRDEGIRAESACEALAKLKPAFKTDGCVTPGNASQLSGGAIALGHPIGASGARVLTTLLYAMKKHTARRGLASLCLGGGNAVAMVIERV